ncbi:lipoprotein insertase outer membrane protein LolB [Candidatus Colwellia aromaticivorans]|uniref:lipoprotein insertase outer membrane protein LolB n=1 Tax=Candidatus Colwellia aromaticivorans TaxID=2267621 RepID=UPI000DF1CFF4|nr:lipoprotein insertase outer membrane protein LolB [Candidatus Colwellia aromaticivorans]
MAKHSSYLFFLLTLSSAILSGCTTKPSNDSPTVIIQQSVVQRTTQLTKINQWYLRGKIAFIEQQKDQTSKRESATIAWRVNENNQTQELNLTSYLGINVLHLASEHNNHLIKVDGKEYRANNLPQLVHSLTGLTLPTKALTFWLKGLPYQASDQVKFSPKTQLPVSLTSLFDNIQWQVDYNKYQVFDGVQMATQFTIKKDGLLIKIAIKKWSLTY